MTASNCAGVKWSTMPSGSIRAGRKTPKTPGSRRVGEATAWIDFPRCMTAPVRTAVLIRRHWNHHPHAMPRNPHAQMADRTAGSELAANSGDADERVPPTGDVNGRLTSSMITDKLDGAASRVGRQRI